MGLDVSHDAWHGGYGLFHLWRQCLANAYGVPLELMEGFWDVKRLSQPDVIKYFTEFPKPPLPISWDAVKVPEAVKELLHHSDCDGEIDAKTCGELAKELKRILPKITSLFPRWTDADVKDLTKKFADGCEAAFKANEPLDFH